MDEGDGAFIVQTQKAMPGIRHPVHPLQRNQFHTQLLREEFDLGFHVRRCNGQVMQSANFVHHPVAFPNKMTCSQNENLILIYLMAYVSLN